MDSPLTDQGPSTGLMSLCRKKQTIRQFKWPDSYGARTAIWYRQRHYDAVDARSLTLRHTERGIFLRYRGLSPVDARLRTELARNVQENQANQISVNYSLAQSYVGLQRFRSRDDWV